MRGADEQPGAMFSCVSLEERVPADHPLRAIRQIADRAFGAAVAAVRDALRQCRATVGAARTAARRAVAASALYDSQ